MAKTRSSSVVWLVRPVSSNLPSTKLPSGLEVLSVFFHHHTEEKQTVGDSARATADELLEILSRARIPTRARNHVVEQVTKYHVEWKGLLKSRSRASAVPQQQAFVERAKELFDIAHRDALSLIKIEEDKLFLQAQWEKGRRGRMAGVDLALARKDERRMMRAVAEAERQAQEKASSAQAFTTVELESSSSSSSPASEGEGSRSDLNPDVDVSSPKRQQGARGVVQVVTPEVAVALDRTNISDRKAAHIFSAMASSSHLGENVGKLIISPSGIRRARIKCREALATEIKDTFRPQVPLILHWDGKITEDCSLPGQETVDRLPVLVSGQVVVKLLAVPKLQAGTAVVMATSILQTLDEWGLKDRISGLCFNTTASNTGLKGGVCVLIERELERDLLNLACRHHVCRYRPGESLWSS